ncbi:hypothetical protein L1D15_04790 [Vibrio sp. Isolate25]|uniref:MGH1-like glycoside hydrolase domain-containing protein n=1 Tax=Vibrio sp. Isolate25 TaxID=2908535 RepID=UPI001EFD2229|nr:trehalase family glycosidase [Vibrio sp. Isolate25]MCG9596037.1 hypothetical protein [Vibrio sp. Isolate25]
MGWMDEAEKGIAIVHEQKQTNFVELYVDSEVRGDNVFIGKEAEGRPLPSFEQIQDKLPVIEWGSSPDVVAGYWKTWQIAFSNLRQPTRENGFVSNFIDTAFNGHLFMWDSAFITMFGKYAHHLFPFIGTLDNLYAKQMLDGFIGRELSIETGQNHFHRHDPSSTGPNILPWAEWQHYQQMGDKQRLSDVFVPILALHRWIADNRTWKDGTYWGCGWSCGMDNQLRVDKKKYDYSHHSHSSWIDVTLHQYLSATLLLKMQEELNTDENLSDIEAEVENLKQVVNEKMWDESRQFYFDTLRDDSFSSIKSIAPYWALLTDMVPDERLAPFVAHLNDENSFKRPHRIPTMSADCEHYTQTGDYWRGGVWAPTNYMVLKGLEEKGFHDLAFDIATNHVAHVAKVFSQTGTLWENYAPEIIQQGTPAKSDFVGWTGLSLVSILIEFVFGIKIDVPNNKLVIRPKLADEYAITQLQFGPLGQVDIHVAAKAKSTGSRVTVTTDLDIEIEVIE